MNKKWISVRCQDPDVYILIRWNSNIVLWCFVSLAMYDIMEIYQNNIIATGIYEFIVVLEIIELWMFIKLSFRRFILQSELNMFTDHWVYCFTSNVLASFFFNVITVRHILSNNILSHPICLQRDGRKTYQFE